MNSKKSKTAITQEIHPDWFYPVKTMQTLILGTYPPHKKRRDFEFYYPNNQNLFWKVLAEIANYKLTEFKGKAAVTEREKLMKILNIGVQNLGKKIERKGESASDSDIKIIEYQDILSLIKNSKRLKVIILAGYSGKTSTYRGFIDYLKKNNVAFSQPKKIKAGSTFNLYLENNITCFITNSTSTAAAPSGVTFKNLVKQFKQAFDFMAL